MADVIPLGGKHRSAKSLLATIMNDPELAACVVVLITTGDEMKYGHWGMTRGDMALGALLIQHLAIEEESEDE